MLRVHNILFGGSFPNHIISLDRLEEDDIKRIIKNGDKDAKDACIIKITVITF